ncbi:MAG: helix-turn-helix domain-containing protein [Oscillospiraceae bacterium]|jgi:phage repressor protein C with HTH and peptisase S24 domain|nr:helix-turn-helix domain-containing protein [Oscillospiraceae bacterium]
MFLQTVSQLLREKGISKSDLSRMGGIPYTTIDGWYKKGTTGVRLETLRKLTSFFDVSFDYLVTGQDTSGLTRKEEIVMSKYRKLDEHGQRLITLALDEELRRIREEQPQPEYSPEQAEREIPLYLTLAAAGYAAPLDGVDYEMLTVGPGVPAAAQFAMKITGDSMEPVINDGQIVYCVKEGANLFDGDIGIFCVDGSYYCKRYQTDDNNNVYLISENRNRADADLTIWSSGNRSLMFVGKVLTAA